MSKGPEANFWNSIRQNLPKKWFATRIENKHGGGVPDVHVVADGVPFWCELKASKSNKLNLSPHQIAWNMAYWARGGASFYLVKCLSTRDILLFEGNQGPSLAEHGIKGSEGHRFKDLGSLFEALRPHAARILKLEPSPAAPRGAFSQARRPRNEGAELQ